MENLIKCYDEYIKKVEAYSILLSIASFDEETVAPESGVTDRANATSFIEGELFAYANNAEIMEKLAQLYEIDTDETRKQVLAYILKEYEKSKAIPQSLVVEMAEQHSISFPAWKEAKEKKDYALFEKALIKNIELTKKMVACMPSKGSVYDTLLDQFEPGMTQEKYDLFFNTIKERLVPFIKKITAAPQIDDALLFKHYDISKQKEVMEILKKLLNYDSKKIYLAESAHPFSSTITPNDGRITVRYLENSLTSAIYSFIHEYGHALYGLQVDRAYAGTPLYHGMSMGMHESQSRLMENHIGKNELFIEKLFNELVTIFPQLATTNPQQFYKMCNVVRNSFIRVEADELTYPLHILVRYELEKAIFNDNLPYEEIKPLWNKLYKEYLGLDVDHDANGILQDVHFAYNSFGYFPTYALGSAFAAQFYETLSTQLNISEILNNDRFNEVQDWLKTNIHRYSASIPSYELVEKVTGKTFDPNIYVDYLIAKFSKIYNV